MAVQPRFHSFSADTDLFAQVTPEMAFVLIFLCASCALRVSAIAARQQTTCSVWLLPAALSADVYHTGSSGVNLPAKTSLRHGL